MKKTVVGMIVAINFILGATFYPHIAVFGVKPDVTLVIVVSLALLEGKNMGIAVGTAAGLLQDIVFGKPVGITALSYMISGYLVGVNSEKIFKENLIVPVVFTACTTIVKYVLTVFFHYILHMNPSLGFYIRSAIFPELIYNCVISVFVYKGLHMILHKRFVEEGFRIRRSR